jgi:hypothetical protein
MSSSFSSYIRSSLFNAPSEKKKYFDPSPVTYKGYVVELGKVDYIRDDAAEILAAYLHFLWRKGLNSDPKTTGLPRMKAVSDSTEKVDINQPYSFLHEEWKKENLAAAKEAMRLLTFHNIKNTLDKDLIEWASYDVHVAWMQRNPKASYNEAQHIPYYQLPETEKEKDRLQILAAIELRKIIETQHKHTNLLLEENMP